MLYFVTVLLFCVFLPLLASLPSTCRGLSATILRVLFRSSSPSGVNIYVSYFVKVNSELAHELLFLTLKILASPPLDPFLPSLAVTEHAILGIRLLGSTSIGGVTGEALCYRAAAV